MSTAPATRVARLAIAAVFFANGFAFANWAARIPAVREGLRLSDGELGTALFAIGAGALLAFRLTACWNAVWGARRVTAVAGLLSCALLAAPAWMGSLPLLALALFLMGAANGAMDVSMNAVAVDVESLAGRPVMSSLHGMWSVGGLGGAVLGSFLARQDVAPTWHLAGVAAGLSLLVAAAARRLPAGPPATAGPAPLLAWPESRLLGLGAIVCCAFLIEGAMADWSAVYLRDGLHTSPAVAALGYAGFSTTMMLMRFAGDGLATRWGAVALLRLGGTLAAAGLGLALLSQQIGMTMLAFALAGLGVATVAPLVFRAAARRSRYGASHGIAAMATMGYGGFLIGPPLIGWLAEATSLRVVLVVAAVLSAAMVGLAHHLREPG